MSRNTSPAPCLENYWTCVKICIYSLKKKYSLSARPGCVLGLHFLVYCQAAPRHYGGHISGAAACRTPHTTPGLSHTGELAAERRCLSAGEQMGVCAISATPHGIDTLHATSVDTSREFLVPTTKQRFTDQPETPRGMSLQVLIPQT